MTGTCAGCGIAIPREWYACVSCSNRLPRDLSAEISDAYGLYMLALRDAGIWWREHPFMTDVDLSTRSHGYVAYSRGCRCEVCRAAKAEYQRTRRAQARQQADGQVVAEITHGRYGYEERGCRCDVCRAARAAMYRATYRCRRMRVRRNTQLITAAADGRLYFDPEGTLWHRSDAGLDALAHSRDAQIVADMIKLGVLRRDDAGGISRAPTPTELLFGAADTLREVLDIEGGLAAIKDGAP